MKKIKEEENSPMRLCRQFADQRCLRTGVKQEMKGGRGNVKSQMISCLQFFSNYKGFNYSELKVMYFFYHCKTIMFINAGETGWSRSSVFYFKLWPPSLSVGFIILLFIFSL